jgi:electron transfer flavoprotein alpha subunit
MPAFVIEEACIGCEACVSVCPVETITMVDGKAIVGDACIDCGACAGECPVEAIEMR